MGLKERAVYLCEEWFQMTNRSLPLIFHKQKLFNYYFLEVLKKKKQSCSQHLNVNSLVFEIHIHRTVQVKI